ncbi:MAG: hypothetical protein V7727_09200 [Sneathiella sp.]
MKKILLAIAIATLTANTSTALTFNSAQFLGIDRDANNEISSQEAASFRARYFALLDQNSNGTVEFEEYVKANNLRSSTAVEDSPVPVTDEYREADGNADTILTLQEFQDVGAKRFKMLDKDKNGIISRAEFVSPGL